MDHVVRSLLENDLYKFSMWQAMLHSQPAAQAEYEFVCRNTPAYPLAELINDVNDELDYLCSLTFSESELAYLRRLRYIKSDFVDFLSIFRFQRRFISAWTEGDTLRIVARGPQVHVTGFEIFVLYIVNELYFRRFDKDARLAEARVRLAAKVDLLRGFSEECSASGAACRHPFEIFDFGLRRRYSGYWQETVVATLRHAVPEYFKGTSNVYLAMKYGLTPIGTMAHEYLQSFQGYGGTLRNFQKDALEAWVQEYRGDLGTALTDVIGMDAFLADFDLYFAKLFDGLRHDSGDPVEWGEKAIAHYESLRIDPHSKRLTFSDGLDLPASIDLYRHFADRIMVGFGIGTNLSNDTGEKALNIVMKLMTCNGRPVAKLSDTPGKTLCKDETFLAYLRQVFNQSAV